ncbi:hypothetical protein FNV43_RR13132 [Rhamnella rubrinervis]|uniref:Dirigent protein n=1 Tax=Rhamnella rubrinervis TaxID=2594499 RepID=A0A8K0MEQ1_9ROSA|nr:hypothetical protein FNV43_RR13132 [Rhamnella rubrinervis]
MLLSSFIILVGLAAATSSEAVAPKYKSQSLKETNIVFYMHDLSTGHNITAHAIAGVPQSKWWTLGFGTAFACDDKLTGAYHWKSNQIGRAQGIYVNSALDGSDAHLLMSLVFTNKEFNGSTLEIQGADRFYQKYREVSVVSGTG